MAEKYEVPNLLKPLTIEEEKRRIYLIDRKVKQQLTSDETSEFVHLQSQAERYLDMIASPPSTHAESLLRSLEERAKSIENSPNSSPSQTP